jgi:hypothetical protein
MVCCYYWYLLALGLASSMTGKELVCNMILGSFVAVEKGVFYSLPLGEETD